MKNLTKSIHPDIHFRVLNTLEENPSITQRDLAKKLKISLGSVNFSIKALIEIGHVKINNFRNTPHKSTYFYLLTPKGFSTKAKLASGFVKRKIAEYEALKDEIDRIKLNIKGHRKGKNSQNA